MLRLDKCLSECVAHDTKITGSTTDFPIQADIAPKPTISCGIIQNDSIPESMKIEIKNERNSQLLLASELGDLEKVTELLDAKKYGDLIADINTQELDNFTPLHLAVSEGHFDVVKFLLENSANPNTKTSSYRTPLHIACYRGNAKIIIELINKNADVNCVESEGNTPAHILSEYGYAECLKIILYKSPDLTLKNKFGLTPLEIASNIEIRELILNSSKLPKNIDTYSRSVVENLVLHNNRSDMIKSLMFKFQIIENSSKLHEETKKSANNLPHTLQTLRQNRRIKIIEASKKIAEIKEDQKISGCDACSIDRVGPEFFDIYKLLGKGSFGEVYLVKYKPSGKFYALKALHKSKFATQNLMKYAMSERNVLCITNHPFIVRLDFAFQTSTRLFLVMQYCPG